MTTASKSRLYYRPSNTLQTLKAVISGSQTPEQIADDLGVGVRTVRNKLHDPLHLGLVEWDGDKYDATNEARRLVQLQDVDVLEERFVDLPGVQSVLGQIKNDRITIEELGRVISFETESGAADEETFERYGRVYAKWIHYLELGDVAETDSGPQHPLQNDRGASDPRVPPQKVIETLRAIDQVNTREELANRLGYSEKEIEKTLSTAYALGVARPEQGGFATTEAGRTVISTSRGQQRELLRDKLLEIPLVQAYCNRVPNSEFKPVAVMEQVSEGYSMGWSEKTIETKAHRLSPWLTFTELADKQEVGVLEATGMMPREELSDP
ncbi:AAA-associated domain-containing protein [Salinigranum salinum]|uniref:AAA-associated domain-containing protein n=1 Tax=Salinigranum salinum TaxID=1364937 RepID=UPI001260E627|nr:AAA-associated domain-containing protein [Salinigranum salinum]